MKPLATKAIALFIHPDPKDVNAKECMGLFLSENQVLFKKEHVNFCQLVIHLHRAGVFNSEEKDYYIDPVAVRPNWSQLKFDHFSAKLKDFADIPNSQIVTKLYLVLRNTYEASTGGGSDSHYYLAQSLRRIGMWVKFDVHFACFSSMKF